MPKRKIFLKATLVENTLCPEGYTIEKDSRHTKTHRQTVRAIKDDLVVKGKEWKVVHNETLACGWNGRPSHEEHFTKTSDERWSLNFGFKDILRIEESEGKSKTHAKLIKWKANQIPKTKRKQFEYVVKYLLLAGTVETYKNFEFKNGTATDRGKSRRTEFLDPPITAYIICKRAC